MSAPVRLAEAVAKLGIERPNAAQWLRRYLRSREAQLGVPILVRFGRGTKRPTYGVSLEMLHTRCPELVQVDPMERTAAVVGRMLEGVRRDMAELREEIGELAANMAALAEAQRAMNARLRP